MVQPDADGRPVGLANGHEAGELLPRLGMVGVEVARIDADLVHEGSDGEGRLGGEMDVRHDGDVDAFGAKRFANRPDRIDLLRAGDRDADEFRAGLRHPAALGERRLHVGGMGVTHRLDSDGSAAADDDLTADRDRD